MFIKAKCPKCQGQGSMYLELSPYGGRDTCPYCKGQCSYHQGHIGPIFVHKWQRTSEWQAYCEHSLSLDKERG